jgi:hypothetical protein
MPEDGGWGGLSGKATAEDEAPKTFNNAEVASWITGAIKRETRSPICAAIYGEDGVGKSGVMMDCRSEEEVKAGKKVIIIDLDASCSPLKEKFFPDDDGMIILDPTTLLQDGKVDYVTTYNKVLAIIRYITENEESLNLKAVCLDGLDTLLKICEQVMRYEDLKVDPNVQIKDQWQWSKRNRRYLTVIQLIKHLHCDRFFTTHMKEIKEYRAGQLVTKDSKPDWEKSTPGIMFQKLFLKRTTSSAGTVFIAVVEKAKGALEVEGKEYTFAEVSKAGTKWTGLKEFYNTLRGA